MLQKYRTLAQIYENCNIVQRFFDFFRDVPRETLGFEAETGPNNKRATYRWTAFRVGEVRDFIKSERFA